MIRKTFSFKFQVTAALVFFGLLFQIVSPALACGPFIASPLFSFTRHADYPLFEYTGGKVGVVPETFGRMSLFVFYRHLNDSPLTREEQKKVVEVMETRIGNHWGNQNTSQNNSQTDATDKNSDYLEKWKTTRAKVLSGDPKISTDKILENDYSYIYNCLPDAFRNATKTLEARIANYGSDANVKEWIKGQDAVFSNCDAKSRIPEDLPESSPEWLRKDRQYQKAAALFYQDNLPEARTAFEQIAADNTSAWNKTAAFVVARTYIREASYIDDQRPDYEPVDYTAANTNSNSNMTANYGGNMSNSASNAQTPRKEIKSVSDKKRDKLALQQKAASQLRNVLNDLSMSEFHESAHRLFNLVSYRSNPVQRRKELAAVLSQTGENKNIYNDLTDYIWLLDAVGDQASENGISREQKEAEQSGKEQNYEYTYKLKLKDVPAAELDEELTDWIFTYQSEDGFAHAFEKFKATKKNLWLVAALAKADGKTLPIEEILSAADKIPASSPAFATARYHQIRILLEIGKRADAKRRLDEIIKGDFKKYNVSTQNKFYALRTAVAENLDEFLKFAQRRAATFVWSDDANEEGINTDSKQTFDDQDYSFDKNMLAWTKQTMFDDDAVAFLNEKIPLSVLKQAATNPQLPDHLKKFLVTAVWTRAFVLKNQAVEREFTPLMQKYAPEYNPVFSKYVAQAPNSPNREAAGLMTILRYPVMQPFVPVGYGRENSDPTAIDSIRGNWWCVKDPGEEYPVYYDRYKFNFPEFYPSFLTPAQTAEAEREQNQLNASASSATHLTRRAVEFATLNPNHPQTPEILHLAVRSTRYGCKDKETGKFSKQAFQILHTRYPNSEWTKKTPYWFG